MSGQNICAKCGACTSVCPVHRVTGNESLSARGRIHLLGRLTESERAGNFRDIFSKCLLCGACASVCPRGINSLASIMEARGKYPVFSGGTSLKKYLTLKGLASPGLLRGLGELLGLGAPLINLLPEDSGLLTKLGLTGGEGCRSKPSERPGRAPTDSGILVFSGCLGRHLSPRIERATLALAEAAGRAGTTIPEGQGCCGLAALSNGRHSEAKRLARRNITAFDGKADQLILTPCASCYHQLTGYPELFADEPEWLARAEDFAARVRELSTFLISSDLTGKTGQPARHSPVIKVLHHDSCHLRFHHKLGSSPRQLLDSLPGVSRAELPGGPKCCGMGGLFSLSHPDLSDKIADILKREIAELAPDLLVTSCSGCLIQLNRILTGEKRPTLKHLAVFLAEELLTDR